ARDAFWKIMIELSRNDKVTIFISTHFMNEAERCDRISLMHQGKVLTSGPPAALVTQSHAKSLEDTFIQYLEAAGARGETQTEQKISAPTPVVHSKDNSKKGPGFFSLRRMMSYLQREALELYRDPIRSVLSIVGSLVIMLAFGYGIT